MNPNYDLLGALSLPPPATPATSTPNESLRLVGGSPTPSTCNASHTDFQQVITTRWGLSLSLHLRCQPHQPPTSHYDSWGALSPPPPAMPATSTRVIGGSASYSLHMSRSLSVDS